MRLTSSNAHNATRTAQLIIGGQAATFRVTTTPGPGSAALGGNVLDFGTQSIGMSPPAQRVTLTNTGAVAISLNDVVSPAGYVVSHDCASIAAGAACTLSIVFTPNGEGSISGAVVLQLSPGSQRITVSGVGEKSLSTHYYRSILRREPDPAGKAFWDGEAARAGALGADPNEAWYAMAGTFFATPEYIGFSRDDSAFLTDLYKTFFNRSPDAGGLAYWEDQLQAGVPRESAVTSFTFSREFLNLTQAIFGKTAVRREVDLVMDLYRGLLARLPDDAGFAYWTGRLRAIQCNFNVPVHIRWNELAAEADAMSRGFVASPEFIARNRTDRQYVADLYNAIFRRGVDIAGMNHWVGQLLSGAATRDTVRATIILQSIEFRVRVQGVLNEICLR